MKRLRWKRLRWKRLCWKSCVWKAALEKAALEKAVLEKAVLEKAVLKGCVGKGFVWKGCVGTGCPVVGKVLLTVWHWPSGAENAWNWRYNRALEEDALLSSGGMGDYVFPWFCRVLKRKAEETVGSRWDDEDIVIAIWLRVLDNSVWLINDTPGILLVLSLFDGCRWNWVWRSV